MSRAIEFTPLSNQQVIEMAPAVGATAPMNGVSERYDFIPTVDAIDLLRDAGWHPVEAKQVTVNNFDRAGFQRHMVRFAMKGMDLGEERLDMLLYNSHDTGCAFRLLAAIWRYICKNGLKHSNELYSFNHMHINFDANKFVESAGAIARSVAQIAPQIESMKQIELTPTDRRDFAQEIMHDVWGDKARITPDALLTERRFGDMGSDLWRTFNVVQENVVKGGVKGYVTTNAGQENEGVREFKTRAVKSLVRDLNINRRMWEITEDFAERLA